MPMRRTLPIPFLFAAAAALLLPAGASAAAGGSIVYAKRGNVYRAHGDGTHQRRLTKNKRRSHPFEHPTQADGGTVVAIRDDTTLYRFSRRGKRLGRARKVATGLRNEGSLHDQVADRDDEEVCVRV